MPIYEYVCGKCSCQFEQLIRGDEQAECPECGTAKVSKQLSVVAAPQVGSGPSTCEAKADGACPAPNCCGGGCNLGGPF